MDSIDKLTFTKICMVVMAVVRICVVCSTQRVGVVGTEERVEGLSMPCLSSCKAADGGEQVSGQPTDRTEHSRRIPFYSHTYNIAHQACLAFHYKSNLPSHQIRLPHWDCVPLLGPPPPCCCGVPLPPANPLPPNCD